MTDARVWIGLALLVGVALFWAVVLWRILGCGPWMRRFWRSRGRYGKAAIIAFGILAALGASTPAYLPMTGGRLTGPLQAPDAILTAGPYIDVRAYGVVCDGAAHASNDADLDNALTAWKAGSTTLISPTGRTCVFGANHTVSFTTQPSGPLTIDLRAGRWLFRATSGTDLHIVTGATNIYPDDITIENGTIEDANSGAHLLVDMDGSALASTGMSRVLLFNATFSVDGYTTTAFQTESTFQSMCINSRAYAPYTAISSTALGYYGFAFLPKSGSGQSTADWTLNRCESFGFDHGVYATIDEVRVNDGTYLLSYEAPVYISGVGYADKTHVENGWMNNASGGGGQRPGIDCIGSCEISGVIANNNGGNQNAAVQIFTGSTQNSTLQGGTFYNLGTAGYVYAYLGAAAGPPAGAIDVIGIPLVNGAPSWSLYTGVSTGITVQGAGNVQASTFNGLTLPAGGIFSNNQSTGQWIQTYATGASSGFVLFGQSALGNAGPEIYFASAYGSGTWGISGMLLDGNNNWHWQRCSNATGVTAPNLGTPAGCVDTALVRDAAYTVATLPGCSSSNKGARAAVTDATSPTFLGTLTGGGSVYAPVACNGTAWVSY